jgi:hypothetical protein
MNTLARAGLLILGDWGTAILTDEERRGLFEIMEDRYERRSARIAAQLPIDNWHQAIGDPVPAGAAVLPCPPACNTWHQAIGDPAPAGAIRDRRIRHAHRIALKSGSMRKKKSSLNKTRDNGQSPITVETPASLRSGADR